MFIYMSNHCQNEEKDEDNKGLRRIKMRLLTPGNFILSFNLLTNYYLLVDEQARDIQQEWPPCHHNTQLTQPPLHDDKDKGLEWGWGGDCKNGVKTRCIHIIYILYIYRKKSNAYYKK